MTKVEEFYLKLYENANEDIKPIYKDKKEDKKDVLRALAMVILTYIVIDNIMCLNKRDKSKEYKYIASMLLASKPTSYDLQKATISKSLTNTVKDTLNFYNIHLSKGKIEKIVNENFKGKHFSKRLWRNEELLNESLKKKIKEFLNGKIDINDIKKEISKLYDMSVNNINRLVETEVNHCISKSFDKYCHDNNITKVRYNAVLDSHTCSICNADDGKIFDIDDKIEVPRHPYCRCFYEEV